MRLLHYGLTEESNVLGSAMLRRSDKRCPYYSLEGGKWRRGTDIIISFIIGILVVIMLLLNCAFNMSVGLRVYVLIRPLD